MFAFDEINEHLDDTIPDEVLDSPDWQPKLLPDLNQLIEQSKFGYEDLVEDDT